MNMENKELSKETFYPSFHIQKIPTHFIYKPNLQKEQHESLNIKGTVN